MNFIKVFKLTMNQSESVCKLPVKKHDDNIFYINEDK